MIETIDRYNKLSQPRKRAVRIILAFMLPFILVWAFVSKFISGIGSAFQYACLEALIELDGFKTYWKSK